MVIHGHIVNGRIVTDEGVSLPEGKEVTIIVRDQPAAVVRFPDTMSLADREKYLAALARVDAMANENPGDSFRGADHDLALYGKRS